MSVVAEGPAKIPPGGLSTRAPRPDATRLRGLAIKIGGALLVLIVATAFIYAFVVAPRMTPRMTAGRAPPPAPAQAQPSTVIAGHAATYDRPAEAEGAALQEPRVGPGSAPTDAQATGAATTPASTAPPTAQAITSAVGAPSAIQEARRSGLFFSAGSERHAASPPSGDLSAAGPVTSAPLSAQALADYDAAYGRHVVIAPRSPFEVKAGTLIPAALLTMVDTGRPGPVVAVTTEPVFDTVTGRTLLIPQGARLIGAQAGDSTYGEKRGFLIWKRIILPDGRSLILEDQAGVDESGATGVPGHADRRWLQLSGAIVASGAISTIGELARSSNDNRSPSLVGDVGDATAIQAVQVGGRLIDRELNVQPKVIIRAGSPVQVLLTKDLVLEPAR